MPSKRAKKHKCADRAQKKQRRAEAAEAFELIRRARDDEARLEAWIASASPTRPLPLSRMDQSVCGGLPTLGRNR